MVNKILLFSLFMMSFVGAQRTTTQNINFYANFSTSSKPELFYLKKKKTLEELELRGTNFGEDVKVMNSGGAFGIFVKPPAEEGEDGKPMLVGQINCDPRWKNVYCVLSVEEEDLAEDEEGASRAGESEEGAEEEEQAKKIVVNGLAFENSTKGFPKGSVKLVNLSDGNLKGEFGGASFEVAPHQNLVVEIKEKSGETINSYMHYQLGEDADWKRLISTRWRADQDKKTVIVITPNSSGKGLKTKTIPIRER